MVTLNIDDWVNVLKNLPRLQLEKCQLVCRRFKLLVETYSKILPYYYIDRCIVYGMLEDDDWEWNEDILCGNLTLSRPDEYYVIRCRKTAHKQCMFFKTTDETLALELRRNLRTTHARKFIFRRLIVTRGLLEALESVFVDVLHCEPFKTFKFDKCTMADEILEKPTLLDRYKVAKNFYLRITFEQYAKFIPFIHKKAVQLADKLVTNQLEPIELFHFAFGINYELRKQNHNFRMMCVAYLPLDNNTMDYILDALLKLMENGTLDKSLECCPFSECLFHIESCGLQNSEVSRDLPIFQRLIPYSTKYDYDDYGVKKDLWSFKHKNIQPVCMVEALAFPDKSTKIRAVLHLWWLYVSGEEDYRLFKAYVIIQNKEKKDYLTHCFNF
ncbi:hypothetical protein Ddc_13693 [Ditylenchus destructor]|nr:hypothetical protein Ddc_13693 [Ditylenchus destructor]